MRTFTILLFATLSLPSLATNYNIVIHGGRVIDPETGLDAIRNVGITADRIAEISEQPLEGDFMINAEGLVVSPGFIDLHAHGQSNTANEYQVHDGVTTALELEEGMPLLRDWLAGRKDNALINYGASVSHTAARILAMEKYAPQVVQLGKIIEQHGHDSEELLNFNREELLAANYDALSPAEIATMNENVVAELEAGGIGIGLAVGYIPGASRNEIFRLFEGAAARLAPIFVHVRDPGINGIQEVISNAATTGTPLHIVHINSMALGNINLAIDMVEAAQDRGFDVTTEMYPYTAASTSIESNFFDIGWRELFAIDYGDLQWQDTGERLTETSFGKYRKQGGKVIIHLMKEAWIRDGIRRMSTMIASDGMPYSPGAHPRSAGTFARVLGRYVREQRALSLKDALVKMTIMPAKRLQTIVPSASRKGRLQVGADADITIFDPETVADTATFQGDLSFSKGIQHVIVNGVHVIRNGETVEGVHPGKAVLGRFRR